MSKRAISIILLTGIILSACGGQATQIADTPTVLAATTQPPADTPTEAPTQEEVTATSESQEADTPTPSATIIPTVFVPENADNCVNQASFVSDVTIPDNTPVTGGTAFTKTWRIQNTGTCIWWSGYTLEHYSEEFMSAPASVPLPVTNPGQTADISIDLVAPTVAGTHRANFVVKNPKGLIMQIDEDSRLWVIINASSAPTSTPTATGATPTGSSSTTGVTGTPASSGSGGSFANASCGFTTDVTRAEQVAAFINTYRSQNNLVAYTVNPQLAVAAQAHANDMACNQLFFHTGSDGSEPADRVAISGYVASKVTENVYGSYPPLTPEGAVNWWKNNKTDPNHNKNLISTDYTEIGIGYAFFDNYGYYVVVFAKP